jgi:hypothetical protein
VYSTMGENPLRAQKLKRVRPFVNYHRSDFTSNACICTCSGAKSKFLAITTLTSFRSSSWASRNGDLDLPLES